MHKILFRGKRKDNGEWVYGYYCKYGCTGKEKHYIIPSCASNLYAIEVIPETIGRYTGVTVGNEKLFECDIVEWYEDCDDTWGYSQTNVGRSVVVWDEENFCWAFKTDGYFQSFNDWSWDNSFIIGNIHDNTESLKGEEEHA